MDRRSLPRNAKSLLIPVLVVTVFMSLAAYSFLLLRNNESSLHDFNSGILQQKTAISDFQLAAQKTITRLYKLTSTAGNESDKIKLKNLEQENSQSIDQLSADFAKVKTSMSAAGIAADKINTLDTLMASYAKSAKNVIDMVDADAATAMAWMTPVQSKFTEFRELLESISNDLTGQKEQRIDELVSGMQKGRYIFTAIIFLVSMIAFGLSFVLSRFMSTLERFHASTSAMLNSMNQGLLFFDSHGICAPIYSKTCLTLLEADPSQRHIGDVLKLSPVSRKLLQTAIDLLYAGKLALGFSEFVGLAPASYAHSANLSISLSYSPITGPDGDLKSILLVATDRTKEKKAESIIKENAVMALRIIRIMRNRNYFIRFIRSFRECMASSPGISAEQLRRDIHTLKGAADTFQFTDLAQALHALEAALPADASDPSIIIDHYRLMLMKTFETSLAIAHEILGENFEAAGNVYTIPEQRLYAFADRLQHEAATGASPQKLRQVYLQELVARPIWQLLDDFAITVQELGDRLGKPLSPCSFSGENFSILPEAYEPAFASFVHIARNIVDHGIENVSLRKERGKNPKATLSIRTETFRKNSADWFAIEFSDDGGGIDVSALRKKLLEKSPGLNLAHADEHTIIQHIFNAGVSTREAATLLSGRGTGLNAVKEEVEKLGGTVAAFSWHGQGVKIRIELPLIRQSAPSLVMVAQTTETFLTSQ